MRGHRLRSWGVHDGDLLLVDRSIEPAPGHLVVVAHGDYNNGEPISHLQAACLLFVGLKLLLPDQESGFDFERKYGVAQGLVGS